MYKAGVGFRLSLLEGSLSGILKWVNGSHRTALALSTGCPELINTFGIPVRLGSEPTMSSTDYYGSTDYDIIFAGGMALSNPTLSESCNCADHLNWVRRGECLYHCRSSCRGWSFLENSGNILRILKKAWFIFLIPYRSDRRSWSTYPWWTKSYTARALSQ